MRHVKKGNIMAIFFKNWALKFLEHEVTLHGERRKEHSLLASWPGKQERAKYTYKKHLAKTYSESADKWIDRQKKSKFV